jgi:hypothetical protein
MQVGMREVSEVLEEARRDVGAMERVDRGRVKQMVGVGQRFDPKSKEEKVGKCLRS